MKSDPLLKLKTITDELVQIDALATQNGVSTHYLESELSSDRQEIRINGNQAGLIHLARIALILASEKIEGSHQHFDESGVLDRCDLPFVVRFKAAEWD
jgi:hypothetical protein